MSTRNYTSSFSTNEDEARTQSDPLQGKPLNVLYQDAHIVAIDKPPGLLVHRSPIDKKETQFAVQTLRDQIGRHVFPAHRLDRPTSGVLLFSFDGKIAASLGEQMMSKQVHKEYHAIVRGYVRGTGMIDYALKYRFDKIADKHRRQQPLPQQATTMYTAVKRFELPFAVGKYSTARYSLVKLNPTTGRKHQLRRHMVHIRHPIVGDTTHGDGKQNKFMQNAFNFRNLALTCTQMGFYHPVNGKWMTVSANMHDNMMNTMNAWRPFEVLHEK